MNDNVTAPENTAAAAPVKSKEKSPLLLEVENHKLTPIEIDGKEVTFNIGGTSYPILIDKRHVAKTGKSAEKVITFIRPDYTIGLISSLAAEAVIRKGEGADKAFLKRLLGDLFEDANEYAQITDPISGATETDDLKVVEYVTVGGLRKTGKTLAELTKERSDIFETMANLSTTPLNQLNEKYGIANEMTAQAMKLFELKKAADALTAQIEVKHQQTANRKVGKKAKKDTTTPPAPTA